MRRLVALAALTLAGCFSPSYHSGGVACSAGTQPCPDGYHCALDRFCWKNGEDPDLATASPPDDLSTVGDMVLRPDFAGFDGGHIVQAITASGGAVRAVGSTHSVTLSVGQKTSGVATGSAHQLQLGILRQTLTK